MILNWGRAKVIAVIENVIRLQCLSLFLSNNKTKPEQHLVCNQALIVTFWLYAVTSD